MNDLENSQANYYGDTQQKDFDVQLRLGFIRKVLGILCF